MCRRFRRVHGAFVCECARSVEQGAGGHFDCPLVDQRAFQVEVSACAGFGFDRAGVGQRVAGFGFQVGVCGAAAGGEVDRACVCDVARGVDVGGGRVAVAFDRECLPGCDVALQVGVVAPGNDAARAGAGVFDGAAAFADDRFAAAGRARALDKRPGVDEQMPGPRPDDRTTGPVREGSGGELQCAAVCRVHGAFVCECARSVEQGAGGHFDCPLVDKRAFQVEVSPAPASALIVPVLVSVLPDSDFR